MRPLLHTEVAISFRVLTPSYSDTGVSMKWAMIHLLQFKTSVAKNVLADWFLVDLLLTTSLLMANADYYKQQTVD